MRIATGAAVVALVAGVTACGGDPSAHSVVIEADSCGAGWTAPSSGTSTITMRNRTGTAVAVSLLASDQERPVDAQRVECDVVGKRMRGLIERRDPVEIGFFGE